MPLLLVVPAAGPQQLLALAGAVASLRTTTPAIAARVSRDGYAPSAAMRSSTTTRGRHPFPRVARASFTIAFEANAPGC